ncbi:hypothetical protein AVEN_50539-1 [Araneus ventricosus]|uniref:DUF19 domain-containing protein n=1 Tax=Araneus ventricosus TaxID=182803 RepID=A0A4Y2ASK6_ARAVE|nr:hypothetical protein AVEN_50539-1 [Araneus ventricosus]
MNSMFLCAFGLFTIVLIRSSNGDNLKYYPSCWNYALCEDGPSGKTLMDCINILTPEELKTYFQYEQENFYNFNSDSLSDITKKYCSFDDDKKTDVYHKLIDADHGYENNVCSEGKEGACSRIREAINCEYDFFQKLQSEGKCQRES